MIHAIIERNTRRRLIRSLREDLANVDEAFDAWRAECPALRFDLKQERQQFIKLRGTIQRMKGERQDLRDRLHVQYHRNKRVGK